MCGIFGHLGYKEKLYVDRHEALGYQHHRGPDGDGWIELENGALGHNRLSILDLSNNAQQPMQDALGRYTLVFNGEIYNYKELRSELNNEGFHFRSDSDTEVILLGYICWGEYVFERLQGMFALAIHDSETDNLLLARDRLGIKPLVYCSSTKGFVFASELKVLVKLGLVKNEIDSIALASLLRFGSVTQPQTLFKNVRQLMPGHVLSWSKSGSISVYPFCSKWALSNEKPEESYPSAVNRLKKLLNTATKAHMLSDVEVGCFLSGGIDSTAVLALMQQFVEKPIKAFSLGFTNSLEVTDESEIAKRSAKLLGADFYRVTVADEEVMSKFADFIVAIDQPSIDGFNTYLVSEVAALHVKVVLSGLGADEIFGGYHHFNSIAASRNSSSGISDFFGSLIHRYRPNRLTTNADLRRRDPINALQQMRQIFSEREVADMLIHPQSFSFPEYFSSDLSPLQSVSLAECTGYLQNTLLRDSDAVSMWHGLEIRPVLLDQNLVRFTQQLPDNFKVRDGRNKAIFKDAISDFIPPEVLNRKKTGFDLPFKRWMNEIMRERIIGLLNLDVAKKIFHPVFLNSVINLAIKRQLGHKHWLLIVLLAWLESLPESS